MKFGHLTYELDVSGLEAAVDVDVSLSGSKVKLVGGWRDLRFLL